MGDDYSEFVHKRKRVLAWGDGGLGTLEKGGRDGRMEGCYDTLLLINCRAYCIMTSPQLPPPGSVSRQQGVVRSLLGIAEGVRGVIERELESRGITLQQYNVLRILADAGDRGLPTLAVSEQLLERAPGITRLMDRLERQGLVARTRGTDRRQVFCSLTPNGAALVEDLQPTVTAAESATVGCLNPNELAALLHFLNRIRSRLPATD